MHFLSEVHCSSCQSKYCKFSKLASMYAVLLNLIILQAHEILALEILTLLVENPTDDSVEVAIAFLKECGDKLTEVSSKALHSIFEMLRNILHEGKLDKRVRPI
jgi:hypothetical protein